MLRRISFVLMWVVAAVAATGIVFAAVSSVAGGVVDPSVPALDAADSFATEEVPRLVDDGSLSGSVAGTVASSSTVTSTTSGATSTSVTSTTAVTSSTSGTSSTTQPGVATRSKTYQLTGGWVRIAYGPGVRLDGAGPRSGFTMNVEDSGPDRVEVEFRSGDHRSSVEAEWKDGSLDDETEERDD